VSDLRVGSVLTNETQPTPADASPPRRDDVPAATRKVVSKPILTCKELKVMELLSYGYENLDIANHFQTTGQAVKNMLRTINLKLGADNRTHAVAICFRNGWLPTGNASQPDSGANAPGRGDGQGSRPRCTRRRYADGSVDSRCTECGLVIARAWRAADLLAADNNHVCQPVERRRAVRFISIRGYDAARADS